MTNHVMTPEQIWKATLSELALQMTKSTFNTWLKDATLVENNGTTFTVGVRNAYAKDWLENRLIDSITRTLNAIAEQQIEVVFTVLDETQSINGRVKTTTTPRLDDSKYSAEEKEKIEHSLQQTDSSDSQRHLPEEVTPDEEIIDRILAPVEDDLLATGFLLVPHYVIRFWKAYLGNVAFDTLLVLSSYWNEQGQDDAPNPDEAGFTIADLERMVGANRHAILGRNARAGRKPVTGAVTILEQENLLLHFVTGTEEGNKRRHHFMIRPLYRLPLLTKKQVMTLPNQLQKDHEKYLIRKKRHIDIDAWEADERDTRVPFIK